MNEHILSALLFPARPVENRVIHISIEGLKALDGSTLNGPIKSLYITKLNPFYSNSMRVRLIAGEFLDTVDDDTIDVLVWYFSKEADLKNYRPCLSTQNPERYNNFKSRWTTASVALSLLAGTASNGRLMKTLGDHTVARDKASQELLDELRGEIAWLSDILKNGGEYGRDMQTVVKSEGHPDYPRLGRRWADYSTHERPAIPGANTKAFFGRPNGLQTKAKTTWGRYRYSRQ